LIPLHVFHVQLHRFRRSHSCALMRPRIPAILKLTCRVRGTTNRGCFGFGFQPYREPPCGDCDECSPSRDSVHRRDCTHSFSSISMAASPTDAFARQACFRVIWNASNHPQYYYYRRALTDILQENTACEKWYSFQPPSKCIGPNPKDLEQAGRCR